MQAPLPTLYKVLNSDRTTCHGGKGAWPPEGEWFRIEGRLVPRKNGLHVCTIVRLVDWLGPAIWEVEVAGERIDQGDKVIARQARLIRRVQGWDEQVARAFAIACAERALPVWEQDYPHDQRPRRAIEHARRYLHGLAGPEEMAEAGHAAMQAARRPSWGTVRDAAEAAAWATAPSAGLAARNAARFAALAAGPARERERRWQTVHLLQRLR